MIYKKSILINAIEKTIDKYKNPEKEIFSSMNTCPICKISPTCSQCILLDCGSHPTFNSIDDVIYNQYSIIYPNEEIFIGYNMSKINIDDNLKKLFEIRIREHEKMITYLKSIENEEILISGNKYNPENEAEENLYKKISEIYSYRI